MKIENDVVLNKKYVYDFKNSNPNVYDEDRLYVLTDIDSKFDAIGDLISSIYDDLGKIPFDVFETYRNSLMSLNDSLFYFCDFLFMRIDPFEIIVNSKE